MNAEVANFSDKVLVSEIGLEINDISSFLDLFFEDLSAWCSFKEAIIRDFEFRLKVVESSLEYFYSGSVSEEESELEEDRMMDLLNELLMLDSD